MKLSMTHDNLGRPKWYAETDDGGYDADGDTPLDATFALVEVLEKEIS